MKKFILFILNTALSFSLYAQTSASFAVLAGTGIANTGLTIINGNVGLHPDTSVTGFPPGVINGTLHVNDAAAIQAKNDLQAAYAYIVGLTETAIIPDQLGGQILGPGIYASQLGAFCNNRYSYAGCQRRPQCNIYFSVIKYAEHSRLKPNSSH